MASLAAMIDAAGALRDALYNRLDGNISDNAFDELTSKHVQATVEARRVGLPDPCDAYDAVIGSLRKATAMMNAASDDDASLSGAAAAAGVALDQMIALS